MDREDHLLWRSLSRPLLALVYRYASTFTLSPFASSACLMRSRTLPTGGVDTVPRCVFFKSLFGDRGSG